MTTACFIQEESSDLLPEDSSWINRLCNYSKFLRYFVRILYTYIKQTFCNFFVTEADQDRLKQAAEQKKASKTENTKARAAPKCKKCGKPWKGHPRGACP